MATLYELTAEAINLYELLSQEEIDQDTVKDTLEAMGVDNKLENYCKLIKQLEADTAAYKAEKDRFARKESVSKNGVERLKNAILIYLNATGQKKASAGLFTVTKSTSQKTNVFDLSKIPAEYIRLKSEPDKTAIKNAILKDNKTIPGAEIIINESVGIG